MAANWVHATAVVRANLAIVLHNQAVTRSLRRRNLIVASGAIAGSAIPVALYAAMAIGPSATAFVPAGVLVAAAIALRKAYTMNDTERFFLNGHYWQLPRISLPTVDEDLVRAHMAPDAPEVDVYTATIMFSVKRGLRELKKLNE